MIKRFCLLISILFFGFNITAQECANKEELKNINNQLDCSAYCAKKGMLPPTYLADFKKECSIKCTYGTYSDQPWPFYELMLTECKSCPGEQYNPGPNRTEPLRYQKKDETKTCCCQSR